jgi:hypothetical protein
MGPTPQSPIPNPQSPIPNNFFFINKNKIISSNKLKLKLKN